MKELKLLLSLGHNSSAIGICDNETVGYEEERLNRKKGTSQFPKLSINKVMKYFNIEEDDMIDIYISHWFDNFKFYKMVDITGVKYDHYDFEFIKSLSLKYKIRIFSLNENFTHHLAHAYSSKSFLKYIDPNKNIDDFYYLVVDGFGNNQEVSSLYKFDNNKVETLLKYNSYFKSLGLLYQYATSFCEMKENQDEYKFLGYESHISEIVDTKTIKMLQDTAEKRAKLYFDESNTFIHIYDTTMENEIRKIRNEINIQILNSVKSFVRSDLERVYSTVTKSNKFEHNQFNMRVVVGFYIQNIIEIALKNLIKHFNIKKLAVSGGVFYNVKLNHNLAALVDEFSVIPLAGDQGAPIGVYEYYTGNQFNFNNMIIGKRNESLNNELNIKYFDNSDDATRFISNEVIMGNIVNVYNGDMEFGPRALCNTSTIALPDEELVQIINKLNGRNTVMPMAPIILDRNLDFFFEEDEYKKIIGSLEYMIITLDYKPQIDYNQYGGIMHKYPLEEKYSGRPQVISERLKDHYIYKVLNKIDLEYGIKGLINTSFNVHGNPICYTINDAIYDFIYQVNHNESNKQLYLVIIKENEDE